MFWSALPAVPIVQAQLDKLKELKFPPLSPPASWPDNFPLVAAIEGPKHIELGKLQMVSPSEPAHQCILSMGEALSTGDDKTKLAWCNVILTAPVRFQLLPHGLPRFWHAHQERQVEPLT